MKCLSLKSCSPKLQTYLSKIHFKTFQLKQAKHEIERRQYGKTIHCLTYFTNINIWNGFDGIITHLRVIENTCKHHCALNTLEISGIL